MNVEFNGREVMKDISASISRIPDLTAAAEKKGLRQIGKVILGKLKTYIPVDFDDYGNKSNYDGSVPYVEMKDDIKMTVTDKNGFSSLSIGGGKKTAFKWHMLDDGTIGPDGRIHTRATHFTARTMKAAEPEVEALIDQMIAEVANAD